MSGIDVCIHFLHVCCACACISGYLDGLIGGSGEEQVPGGVDAQAPHGTLVADKCPLALEDLLGVVCYAQAQTWVRQDTSSVTGTRNLIKALRRRI